MNATTAQTPAPLDALGRPRLPDRAAAGRRRGALVPRRPDDDQVHARGDRRRASTVTENLAPRGIGSPLHVHHNEDEWFYVIEGELTFWVGGEVTDGARRLLRLRPARRPAHLHRQLRRRRASFWSPSRAGFEGFIRALSEPAGAPTLPPASLQPPDPPS